MSNIKTVTLVIGEGGRFIDVEVSPAQTVQDVLTEHKLPNELCLSKQAGQPVFPDEELWPCVVDGEQLYLCPCVGCR